MSAPAVETPAPKVTLHWLEQSRSQRLLWLLQECKGIDLEIKVYKRGSDLLAPKELKEIHPLGKSPLVTVEAANQPRIVLAESAAICEYFTDYFAKQLAPARYTPGKEGVVGGESESWIRYRHLMHYAEGSLMSLLMVALFMDQIKTGSPFFIKPITNEITNRVDKAFLNANYATNFGFLDEQVKTSPDNGEYITGAQLTAADIMLSYPLIAAKAKIDLPKYPHLAKYIEKLEQEPGYLASIKKIEEITGEPFSVSLRERK